MIIRFEWGPPQNRGHEIWALERVPREGEYVCTERYSGFVKSVVWDLEVPKEPTVVVRLS